ncbi:MAG: hypothetical protein IJB86_08535 [Clostridia bacterium]|nr:hypothetical protein [Clostridia bacterium]
MTVFDDFKKHGTYDGESLLCTESFCFDKKVSRRDKGFVVVSDAKYKGRAPHISFSLTVDGQAEPLYVSHDYIIGGDGVCEFQKHRIAPIFLDSMTLTVRVEIPNGTQLFIKNFDFSDVPEVPYTERKIRFNAHLGLWGMAPDNTLSAFRLAANAGFLHCIAVPKVTKDGVIVCIHDDTINRTAGNAPTEPVCVRDLTYNELMEFEYGSYKNEVFKGEKLPKLTEFFDICKETGMTPMFSTHPDLPVEKWQEVKAETDKRGLTSAFHIKGFGADILRNAFSVFGNVIDGYTLDSRRFDESLIKDILSIGIDRKKCRIGIEIPFDRYTKEIADKILAGNLFAAAYSIKKRSQEEYQRLVSYGVTEFTEDLHCPC